MSDRKYRQRGYMDDDAPEKGRRSSRPRERSDKPRGRGLGAPTKDVFRCGRCGQAQTASDSVPTDSQCSGCGEALHSCTNCAHFDSAAPKECRQPVEIRIAGKAKANECALFSPKITQEFEAESPSPDDARSAFDSLFKF